MNTKMNNPRFWFIVTVIVSAAAMRLIPHWPNVTPIAAMALFAGAYISRRVLAFIIPMAAMFLSDLVLGLHNTMPAVYIGFAVTVVIGMIISKRPGFFQVLGGSLASTLAFFLITNFGAWLGSPFYPQTAAGLMESYVAGLAFFNDGSQGISFFVNSLLGDLFYTGLFFGALYLAGKRFPVLARA